MSGFCKQEGVRKSGFCRGPSAEARHNYVGLLHIAEARLIKSGFKISVRSGHGTRPAARPPVCFVSMAARSGVGSPLDGVPHRLLVDNGIVSDSDSEDNLGEVFSPPASSTEDEEEDNDEAEGEEGARSATLYSGHHSPPGKQKEKLRYGRSPRRGRRHCAEKTWIAAGAEVGEIGEEFAGTQGHREWENTRDVQMLDRHREMTNVVILHTAEEKDIVAFLSLIIADDPSIHRIIA
jgi:hypothetical protein